jgi:type III secretion protein S
MQEMILSLPPVIVATLVSLVIAVIQAATQIQEQTILFLVKLIGVTATILVMSSFFAGSLMTYSDRIFTNFNTMVRR